MSDTVDNAVAPSKKVTDPLLPTAPARLVTVAVKVTFTPRLAETSDETSVVVVAACATVIETGVTELVLLYGNPPVGR